METRNAPRGVKALGWSCLVFGAFLLGVAALSLALWLLVPEAFEPAMSALPGELEGIRWLRAHWTAYTLGQAVVGAAHLAVGMGLLRLKAWARAALEAICWLALAVTLVSVWGLRSSFSSAAADFLLPGWLLGLIGLLLSVAQLVGLVLLIRFLRREKTRAVFASGARAPGLVP
jgi:hypothetical protein